MAVPASSTATKRNSELADDPESVLLDLRAAARLLGLTFWRVYALVKNGELPVVVAGGKFYLRRSTLLRWAETSEAKYKATPRAPRSGS